MAAAADDGREPPEPLRVFAAGSLRPAFDALAAHSPTEIALTYANARQLADRIADGARADVFASASAADPRRLRRAGLAGAALPIAGNEVVVAVAAASTAADASVLAAPAARVVIEIAGIPLGDYTRTLLDRLEAIHGAGFARRALANVVAEKQLVDDVAAALLCGDADAGVLYASDVVARAPRLRAIAPPPAAAVRASYVACVTTAAGDRDRAAAWIAWLTEPAARATMRRAGFGAPG